MEIKQVGVIKQRVWLKEEQTGGVWMDDMHLIVEREACQQFTLWATRNCCSPSASSLMAKFAFKTNHSGNCKPDSEGKSRTGRWMRAWFLSPGRE